MATYTIDIAEDKDIGVTEARNVYNSSLTLEPDQVLEDHPDYKADNEAYVQFVMNSAADSYTKQYT